MNINQKKILLSLSCLLVINIVFSQINQNDEKIRGERYFPILGYRGPQFFLNEWADGKVIFTSGEDLDSLKLKFDISHNELIVFNMSKNQMVKVDKETVAAFELDLNQKKHFFEKRHYMAFGLRGDKYMELLYDGNVRFYCFRNAVLLSMNPYTDENGILKNMEFVSTDKYFFVGANQEYYPCRIKRKSIINYLSKSDKRIAKKHFRQKGIVIDSETEFIKAIRLLEQNNISLVL